MSKNTSKTRTTVSALKSILPVFDIIIFTVSEKQINEWVIAWIIKKPIQLIN